MLLIERCWEKPGHACRPGRRPGRAGGMEGMGAARKSVSKRQSEEVAVGRGR